MITRSDGITTDEWLPRTSCVIQQPESHVMAGSDDCLFQTHGANTSNTY